MLCWGVKNILGESVVFLPQRGIELGSLGLAASTYHWLQLIYFCILEVPPRRGGRSSKPRDSPVCLPVLDYSHILCLERLLCLLRTRMLARSLLAWGWGLPLPPFYGLTCSLALGGPSCTWAGENGRFVLSALSTEQGQTRACVQGDLFLS